MIYQTSCPPLLLLYLGALLTFALEAAWGCLSPHHSLWVSHAGVGWRWDGPSLQQPGTCGQERGVREPRAAAWSPPELTPMALGHPRSPRGLALLAGGLECDSGSGQLGMRWLMSPGGWPVAQGIDALLIPAGCAGCSLRSGSAQAGSRSCPQHRSVPTAGPQGPSSLCPVPAALLSVNCVCTELTAAACSGFSWLLNESFSASGSATKSTHTLPAPPPLLNPKRSHSEVFD